MVFCVLFFLAAFKKHDQSSSEIGTLKIVKKPQKKPNPQKKGPNQKPTRKAQKQKEKSPQNKKRNPLVKENGGFKA